MFTYALHTYSRAYPGAPKAPLLGSVSGRTGQAAVVIRIDDPPPSGPRARAFPGLGAHRGMGMAGGASFSSPPRCCRVLPLSSPTKNSFQRSARWSPAMHTQQPVGGLRGGCARRASGVGKHLFRRWGGLEGHGEHQHDGAEGLQPLGPSAGRAPASTPTRSRDGRRCASLGHRSCSRTRPHCSADASAARSGQLGVRPAPSVSVESAAATARVSPRSDALYEHFVRVSTLP